MTESTAVTAARAVVGALIAGGVQHAVLSPGSRSAPLAFALVEAEKAGLVTLHVRSDERTAGFLALGIGKATGTPAVVVTTSGTAVANLAPAVMEAHHANVPIIIAPADRPRSVRGTWANQTSDLQAMFFPRQALRSHADVADNESPELVVDQAIQSATGAGGQQPGPAFINLGFAEPLVPTNPWTVPTPPPFLPQRRRPRTDGPTLESKPSTVVVAGDDAGPAAAAFAGTYRLPLFAEPSSNARFGENAIAAYRLLLDIPLAHQIERVIVFGRPTLSRSISTLLDREDVDIVMVAPRWQPGPDREVTRLPGAPRLVGEIDDDWLNLWITAGRQVEEAFAAVMAESGELTALHVAQQVFGAKGDLVIAASNAIRDIDLMGVPRSEDTMSTIVVSNRGLSGIDGSISTAVGVSASRRTPTRLLVGDLAFLHDVNALNIPIEEVDRIQVQVIVINDNGGGIFATLEYGEERFEGVFDRIFGTPHDSDLAELTIGFGVRHQKITEVDAFEEAIENVQPGIEVLEVPVDRGQLREISEQVRNRVRG